ncbi:MAG: non-canonical purine NTP pyrophosphatase, partial [Eubacteriales bacterium]|nr:non-canonical purine NTP pyrophosphatase [Eubacteriales bacterium]
MTDLWIATHNEGKVKEMRTIASSFPVTLKTAAEAGEFVDFPETGTSFDENALEKARALHQVTGDWVAADDSGLCVDSLGGAPGIYSARYSGADANDRTNVALLL